MNRGGLYLLNLWRNYLRSDVFPFHFIGTVSYGTSITTTKCDEALTVTIGCCPVDILQWVSSRQTPCILGTLCDSNRFLANDAILHILHDSHNSFTYHCWNLINLMLCKHKLQYGITLKQIKIIRTFLLVLRHGVCRTTWWLDCCTENDSPHRRQTHHSIRLLPANVWAYSVDKPLVMSQASCMEKNNMYYWCPVIGELFTCLDLTWRYPNASEVPLIYMGSLLHKSQPQENKTLQNMSLFDGTYCIFVWWCVYAVTFEEISSARVTQANADIN